MSQFLLQSGYLNRGKKRRQRKYQAGGGIGSSEEWFYRGLKLAQVARALSLGSGSTV